MKTYSWHSAGGSLSDTYDVVAQVTNITTLSGAPASVTVTTPVVDLGKSLKCTVQRVPDGLGTLEWRASDTAFAPDASSPAWSNPTGEYRYWQARVTWTDPSLLLERIEFDVGYLIMQFVMLRNRFIWEARTSMNPVVVPFKPVAWSHRVSSINQVADGYEVTFAEDAPEYSLLLEER